jgi:hypothetical protein
MICLRPAESPTCRSILEPAPSAKSRRGDYPASVPRARGAQVGFMNLITDPGPN